MQKKGRRMLHAAYIVRTKSGSYCDNIIIEVGLAGVYINVKIVE